MKTGFEDAFTDVQSEYVALARELVPDGEDLYLFIYQNAHTEFFNAYFRRDGKILRDEEYGRSEDELLEFLEVGLDYTEKLYEVCEAYSQPCPNQLKLTYHTATGAFDAEYGYEDYAAASDLTPLDVFLAWGKAIETQ